MRQISAVLGSLFLRLIGWELVGLRPEEPKFLLVAAPHTSNWDFLYMYVAAKVLKFKLSWMGKDSLFRGMAGPLMRALGGVAINRRSSNNMVEQMVQQFNIRDAFVLAVPPSGTRSRTDYWKSGFYYIALNAKVPLGLGFIDYKRKQVGVGDFFMPTGDVKQDLARIRAFYSDITAKFPKETSTIAFKPRD